MLPRTYLSDCLENKVNKLVKIEGKEEEVGEIHIRTLYNKTNHVEVKEKMIER